MEQMFSCITVFNGTKCGVDDSLETTVFHGTQYGADISL
jgi:hypothetical protein